MLKKKKKDLTSTRRKLGVPSFLTETRDPLETVQFVAVVAGETERAALVVLLSLHLAVLRHTWVSGVWSVMG